MGCGGGDDRRAQHPVSPTCAPGQVFDGRQCVAASGPTNDATTNTPPADAGSNTVSGGSARELDAKSAAPAVALLAPLATQAVPQGANPLGDPLAGEFQTGQSLERIISMQAGRCYSVLAAGAPGIQNVDLQLVPVSPLPGIAPVVGQDQTAAPTATVGEKPNCFKALFAGSMKVVLAVSAGQGIAAAQIYEK
jgi:hypothetical protein